MIEMTVESVRISAVDYQRVVVLKEKDAKRYLLIWVGSSEAGSIAMALQGVTPPRPLSHDLMKDLLDRFDAHVTRILVNGLKDETYYAVITVTTGPSSLEIDARPSDAIALALRSKAPIYAEEEVLEKAGIMPETSTSGEGDQLAVFRDFINTLDLSGLDVNNEGPGNA